MDTMLDICKLSASEYDVMFNPATTKLLVFERNVDQAHVNFMDKEITCGPIEKHLGNVIGYDCEKPKHKMDSNTLQFITQVNGVHYHFRNVTLDVKYKLFNSTCMPLYGCQLWDWNQYTHQFQVTWRKCIRKLMDIPQQTHCRLLHYICDIVVREQLFSILWSFVRGPHTSDNSFSEVML